MNRITIKNNSTQYDKMSTALQNTYAFTFTFGFEKIVTGVVNIYFLYLEFYFIPYILLSKKFSDTKLFFPLPNDFKNTKNVPNKFKIPKSGCFWYPKIPNGNPDAKQHMFGKVIIATELDDGRCILEKYM